MSSLNYLQNKASIKRYREKHKRLGLCRECTKPAIPYQHLCVCCSLKKNERDRKYYFKDPEKSRERYRLMREERRLKLKCLKCGCPLNDEDKQLGFKTCSNCRQALHRPIGQPYYRRQDEDYNQSITRFA